MIMVEKTIPENKKNENAVVKREITRNPKAYVTPLTDIFEEENGLYLKVDLPGVDKDGLKIRVENSILTIEGHIEANKERDYLFREFEPSNYFRQFELTDSVDQGNIEAELKNGVLSLYLPKAEELKPRTIDVKFG
jgi:HSP20 family molecular chaperone IbpA